MQIHVFKVVANPGFSQGRKMPGYACLTHFAGTRFENKTLRSAA
jgi:hypothetical protein